MKVMWTNTAWKQKLRQWQDADAGNISTFPNVNSGSLRLSNRSNGDQCVILRFLLSFIIISYVFRSSGCSGWRVNDSQTASVLVPPHAGSVRTHGMAAQESQGATTNPGNDTDKATRQLGLLFRRCLGRVSGLGNVRNHPRESTTDGETKCCLEEPRPGWLCKGHLR
jgi:hypothetical protein